MLTDDDFPLKALGTLIFSPDRVKPVIQCADAAIARQIINVLNYQADQERERPANNPNWLVKH